MSYQSEAALEENLIQKLASNGYERVTISDIDALELNFRNELEKHNNITFTDSEFKKVRNHLDGGSLFDKAKKLRDKFVIQRDTGNIYVEFINVKEWKWKCVYL